jgi:hypothetical protein
MAQQLAPLPYAVGVIPQFCNHQTVSLRMKSSLFMHPDTYTIMDNYNNPVIQCALQVQKSGQFAGMTYQVYSATQRKGTFVICSVLFLLW